MKACVSAGPHTFRQQLQGNDCQENESGDSPHEANVGPLSLLSETAKCRYTAVMTESVCWWFNIFTAAFLSARLKTTSSLPFFRLQENWGLLECADISCWSRITAQTEPLWPNTHTHNHTQSLVFVIVPIFWCLRSPWQLVWVQTAGLRMWTAVWITVSCIYGTKLNTFDLLCSGRNGVSFPFGFILTKVASLTD